MKRGLWTACSLLVLALSAQAEPLDMFIGTLEKRAEGWTMTRCDLAKERYLLLDGTGKAEGFTAMLPAQAKREGKSFTVWVIASYQARGARHTLRVSRIHQLEPDSCHLDELL